MFLNNPFQVYRLDAMQPMLRNTCYLPTQKVVCKNINQKELLKEESQVVQKTAQYVRTNEKPTRDHSKQLTKENSCANFSQQPVLNNEKMGSRRFSKPSGSKKSLINFQQILSEQQKHIEELLQPAKNNNNETEQSQMNQTQSVLEQKVDQEQNINSTLQLEQNSTFNKIINLYEEQNEKMKKKLSQSAQKFSQVKKNSNELVMQNKPIKQFQNSDFNDNTERLGAATQIIPEKDDFEKAQNQTDYLGRIQQDKENEDLKNELNSLKAEGKQQIDLISKLQNQLQLANQTILELKETIKLLNCQQFETQKQQQIESEKLQETIQKISREKQNLQQFIEDNNERQKQENNELEQKIQEIQYLKQNNNFQNEQIIKLQKRNQDLENESKLNQIKQQIPEIDQSQQVFQQKSIDIQYNEPINFGNPIPIVNKNEYDTVQNENNFFDQLEDYQSYKSNQSQSEINEECNQSSPEQFWKNT